MKNKSAFRKAWELLDQRERRNAVIVLAIMMVSALAAAGMVGSIFPFLSVLSDPGLIRTNWFLSGAYQLGGFSSDFEFVVALGLSSIVVIVASSLMLLVNTWARVRFSQMRMHSISHRLLSYYLAQPYEFFLSRHSGDMSTNILSEAERVVRDVIGPGLALISSALTIVTVVGILFLANPIVAGLALGIFGAIYAGTALATRRFARHFGQKRAEANAERFRIAGEGLGGVKDIKLLGREATYVDRYVGPSILSAKSQAIVGVLAQGPRFIIQMIAFGGMIILALLLLDPAQFGRREALSGLLPLLGLLAFAGQRLLPELQAAYQSLIVLSSGCAALDRVHADLSASGRAEIDRGSSEPIHLRCELILSKITYRYPGAQNPSLDDVSLRIRAGERIGVIGSSGAGKTTLADVVLGLLKPHAGTLKVDKTLLNPHNIRGWQRAVGYVPQEIFLTDASLAENIALGVRKEDIDPARIERASRSAMLHEFALKELPDGYATPIGERGVRLSGGQRQRIGIARALYHDADLILFDEATSALDNLTEAEVMAAIDALPGDKTVLIIAHRLSTVKRCDRIVMMDKGAVAGVGSWENLAECNAAFRALAVVA